MEIFPNMYIYIHITWKSQMGNPQINHLLNIFGKILSTWLIFQQASGNYQWANQKLIKPHLRRDLIFFTSKHNLTSHYQQMHLIF